MKISLAGPAFANMDPNLGYGQASYNIYHSLNKLGIDVEINAKKADIEICFAHPSEHIFNDRNSYKIAYSAWESTELKPEWYNKMSRANEIWATSDWVENVWKQLFNKPIFVYKHGINSIWKPKLRKNAHSPFTFLHVGEPFSRKDAQLTVETFIELFGDNPDYRLVMKSNGMNTVKISDPKYGFLGSPSAVYSNILTIDSYLTNEQMVGLHELCDVFVYPSWGEGWGLQPMQALATGMPVISTIGWSDYAEYVNWPVDSKWSTNPWQDIHPGLMMQPDKISLKKQMQKSVEEYDSVLKETFRKSFEIHRKYDWVEMTKPAVTRLHEIYNTYIKY